MKKYLIILFTITAFITGQPLSPIDNANINYTHVLFEWGQIEGADSYQLQISEDELFLSILTDTNSESLIYIEKERLDWSLEYFWRVRGVSDEIEMEWSDTHSFTISTKRSEASSILYNENDYAEGLTIFSSFFDYFTAIIDKNGEEVWNSEQTNIVYYTTDNYGQFFGTQFGQNEDELPGLEFSIDSEIRWMETGNSYVHHDFFKLPNGNYLGIIESHQNGPIPEDINPEILALFQMLGYPTYPTNESFFFPWVGDKIVEWDQDGNIVWEWDTFDNLNWLTVYDIIGGTWDDAYLQGRHDWTHSNALLFNESDNSILLSSRHLSRIIKISYPSGEIIWQMGLGMPSGDVDCGIDLNFSFQHGLQVLENGNIVTLDNGNISQFIYNTEYPTTRALEIQVVETSDGCEANVVWEYSLPEELFGFASGNVQKMDNGNYLITTVGGGATSLEIKPTGINTGDIVWEGNYNLTIPSGAVYRAHRIDSLHPIAFSVISNSFIESENTPFYSICNDDNNISFKLWNNGSINETFNYNINGMSGSYSINPNSHQEINYQGIIGDEISLTITPLHRPDLEKNITMQIINECHTNGDLNFDNSIDLLDIVIIINYIIGDSSLDFIELQLANINNDNNIDLFDIMAILQIILNQ